MPDISYVFVWWTTVFLVSLTVLPFTFNLFHKFVDRGYIFAKILGLLLSSYLIWLLGSLHLLPFTKLSIFLVLIFFAIVNIVVFRRNKKSPPLPFKWIILEEIMFFATLLFWSFVRGSEPSIRGLEKFMDYGFVNSILKSNFFPPLDMWLTKSPDYNGGYFINYYYFGHYYTAFLTKLSGLNSAVTYNLMLATLFAFSFSLAFSLGANLLYFFLALKKQAKGFYELHIVENRIKLVLAGLLSAFLLSLAGNLHTIYTFTTGYPNETPKPFWQLEWGFHPERYWYPNATRFIPNTIHEFPIYSFVVADLHGHVADIPFVLLIIALLLNLTVNNLAKKEHESNNTSIKNQSIWNTFINDYNQHSPIPISQIFLLGLTIAVMYMTNAWDGLIYLVLTGLVFLYLVYKNKKSEDTFITIIFKTASSCLFLVFFFLLSNFPFMVNFRPFVSGLGVLCAPDSLGDKKIGPFLFEKDHCQRSEIWMMALLWGYFYYNVFGYFVFAIKPTIFKLYSKLNVQNPIKRYIIAKMQAMNVFNPIDIFAIILILISTLLLIFPEFFYIKDIYPAHYRANTMFKLGYQAFMMLSLISGFTIFRLKSVAEQNGYKSLSLLFYNSLYIILFTLVAIYPYYAINSYYGKLNLYKGQDGILWMQDVFPEDYKAITWLRENVACQEGGIDDCNNQPVIAEAVGESYTDYARVSSYTGLPTIVGWPVHEWLWRGSYDEAGKRIPEVQKLYESQDLEEARKVITKYNVEYIFLGSLEKEKYPNLSAEKFETLGNVVFEEGQTKIYRISP